MNTPVEDQRRTDEAAMQAMLANMPADGPLQLLNILDTANLEGATSISIFPTPNAGVYKSSQIHLLALS